MKINRQDLFLDFADGKIPTGNQFHALIESIISRYDDGIDKTEGEPLKISAGNEVASPVISLSPHLSLDPDWILSLNANGADGLNFGQGTSPTSPVLFLSRQAGNIGLGTAAPNARLDVFHNENAAVGMVVENPNTGDKASVYYGLKNDNGEGQLFRNSSTSIGEGGPNAMTLRNNKGDLRLQSESGNARILLKKNNGTVGINIDSPENTLDLGGDLGMNGHNILFAANSKNVGEIGQAGLFWQGKNTSSAPSYGIYRTAGPWSPGAYQQLRLQFDTGIQLGAGTGNNTGFDKSFVEIVNGKGLMLTSGGLGLGTTSPNSMLDLASGAMLVNAGLGVDSARPPVGKARLQGEIGGYSNSAPTNDDGFLRLSAGGGTSNFTKSFIDLTGNSNVLEMKQNIRFGTSGLERLRIDSRGYLGLGTNDPQKDFELVREVNSGATIQVHNKSAGTSAYTSINLKSDTNGGYLIKNSSLKTADGGANTMTLRNTVGDLRFQTGGGMIWMKGNSDRVGIGTDEPYDVLDVYKDADGIGGLVVRNPNAGANAFSSIRLYNDYAGFGTLYKNSRNNTAKIGGPNGMVLHNTAGDLELRAGSNQAFIRVKGNADRIGFGIEEPSHQVSIAGHGTLLNNRGLLFGNLGERVSTTAALNAEVCRYEIGFAGYRDSEPLQIGAKISAIRIANYAGGTPTHVQATELAFSTGTGYSVSSNSQFHETAFERMRINRDGKVGIGTAEPTEQLEVYKSISGGCMVNATNPALGNTWSGFRMKNDNDNEGHIFRNSSARTADGGANAMTVRNLGGDLLMVAGDASIVLDESSGHTGIGIRTPGEFVDVYRDRDGSCGINVRNPNAGTGAYTVTRWKSSSTEGQIFVNSAARTNDGGVNTMTIRNTAGDLRLMAGSLGPYMYFAKGSNCIGIGTSEPNYPLHITTKLPRAITWFKYYAASGTGTASASAAQVSFFAEGRVVAAEFNATSDRRIKTDIEVADGKSDQNIFKALKFSNYQYKDFLANGSQGQKGLIAQEVEEIYPEAVEKLKDFIPNVYENPESVEKSIEGIRIQTKSPHDFVSGDLVRIYSEEKQIDRHVEVIDEHQFLIKDWTDGHENLFVYGKQVDDFRVVNYNKIFCLGMSATQEIQREVQELKSENEFLRGQIEQIRKQLGWNEQIFEA